MKVTVKVEGLKEIDEALKELPKRTAKNVLRRALVKSATPMIEAAIARAPRKLGKLRRTIVMSKIKFSNAKSAAFNAEFAAVMKAGGTKMEAAAAGREAAGEAPEGVTSAMLIWGPLRSTFYGYFQEFGTAKMAPRPFMRPAWESNKEGALEIMKTELWNEITKAAERLARKTARLAEK